LLLVVLIRLGRYDQAIRHYSLPFSDLFEMRIARVIGKLTLARAEASLTGARYLIAIPLSLESLKTAYASTAEELVVYDELGASEGQLIAISESAEAAAPFHPNQKPVDAYCAAILDTMEFG